MKDRQCYSKIVTMLNTLVPRISKVRFILVKDTIHLKKSVLLFLALAKHMGAIFLSGGSPLSHDLGGFQDAASWPPNADLDLCSVGASLGG